MALESRHAPTVLCLTRQNLPQLPGSSIEAVLKGGYTLIEPADAKVPDLILIATGSEVTVAVDAAKRLSATGLKVRVVSMPSTTLFDRQPVAYRRQVITPGVPTVSIEALTVFGWDKYSHLQIGMTTFGASAGLDAVMKHFGFTGEAVATKVTGWLEAAKKEAAEIGGSVAHPLPTHFSTATASEPVRPGAAGGKH